MRKGQGSACILNYVGALMGICEPAFASLSFPEGFPKTAKKSNALHQQWRGAKKVTTLACINVLPGRFNCSATAVDSIILSFS